jgi:hypothetical protein
MDDELATVLDEWAQVLRAYSQEVDLLVETIQESFDLDDK